MGHVKEGGGKGRSMVVLGSRGWPCKAVHDEEMG